MHFSRVRHRLFVILFFLLLFASCQDNYQPKPRGYFRIQMPKRHYKRYASTACPYSMELPAQCHVVKAKGNNKRYWINIIYPYFNAQLHLSYKKIDNNLGELLNDNHKLMSKHMPKANAISEQIYSSTTEQVYGNTYSITGQEVASPFQFYLTDSTQHFVRAALYFNFTPNNDSLIPVIHFLQDDIKHMIETFRWTDKEIKY